eukprot:TRINITY_DN20686_c0_g1_i1.p1 TRINITY_DN20686_c0_g1~~TRINITY_DN20686_c0_g1_i1.p1  ORF type:complete len:173 (+),score=48.62 TRINITY_DN20686_c0_g1_i1:26-544(+)
MTETTASKTESQNYWSGYYATHNIGDPSLFAQFVSETVASSGRLLDIGCGTGRDSYHFAKSGCDVIAVDLAAEPKDATKCIFKKGDMGKLEELNLENGFDTFYSRFSIHSVPEHIQAAMFKQAKELLKVGGVLCIEARSTKDPLYGVGTPMGRHAFAGKTGHADARDRKSHV